MNVVSMFMTNAHRFPGRPFLIDGTERISYAEMALRARRLARGLMELGLAPGDVVGLFCRNRYEWVELFYGIALAGGVVCPMNFRLVGRELTHVVNHSGAKFLIYDRPVTQELARVVVGQAPGVQQFIHLDEPCPGTGSLPFTRLYELGADPAPVGLAQQIQPESLHMIMYTSGTTGLPKGVLITHANTTMAHFSNSLEWGFAPDDCILITPPLCHRTGFGRIVNAGGLGATCVLMREFRPETAMELIDQERVTAVGIVPTMMRMMLRLPELSRWRRDHVRMFVLTGEACPPPLKEAMMREFPNGRIFTYFASTEGGQMTSLRPEDQITKSMSVGPPVPGVEISVVDDQGQPVPTGQDGEIWVRTGTPGKGLVMQGYLKNPEANREHFTGDWFHTGDAGRFDEDGYLYVTDRKKDMILSGGLNIYSKEVENTIAEHPGVADVAVVGVPDPEWGEAVLACVVPHKGQTLTVEEIIQFCKERLASYKKPRHVRFLPDLPRNSVGKVLKFVLREQAVREG